MQLIRAAVWQSSIWITPPTSNPLSNLDAAHLLQFNPETKQFVSRPLSQDLWNQYKPTTVSLTPMQLSLILNEPSSASILSDFEVVLIGGQALSAEIEQRLITDYPNTRFIHTFGSTETASHFAGREITPDNSDYLIAPGTQIKTNQLGEFQIANPTTKQPLPQIQAALSSLNKLEQPKEIVFIPAVQTLSNGKIYRNPNP